MVVCAYVGVGSNIDPERNVLAAVRALARVAHVAGVSTFYRTAALGRPNDPFFVNGVLAVDTDAPALALKRDVLRRIERELGRRRGADPDAPRTIDLDLLLYDGAVCRTDALTLPDPAIAERAFVAWPLAELAPGLALPDGRSIRAIAEGLGREGMAPLAELTAALREAVLPIVNARSTTHRGR
jgi:2-amino-4-hydroxy-6-hydroxymethyldihydropteridine diphosphokinase